MPDLDPPTRLGPLPWRDRLDLLTQSPAVSPARVAGGVAVAVALAIGAWLLLRSPTGPPPETFLPMAGEAALTSTTSSSVPTSLLVHAAGAVQRPGVYELPSGSRVTDLIDAAGGPTADADVDQLNLAAPVVDGERVYVPRVGEVVTTAVAGADASSGPLDLNTATLEQLDELPGVGPATAQAIIDERDRRGGFTSVDDLLDVRGIGPAKLEGLRDLVRV